MANPLGLEVLPPRASDSISKWFKIGIHCLDQAQSMLVTNGHEQEALLELLLDYIWYAE